MYTKNKLYDIYKINFIYHSKVIRKYFILTLSSSVLAFYLSVR